MQLAGQNGCKAFQRLVIPLLASSAAHLGDRVGLGYAVRDAAAILAAAVLAAAVLAAAVLAAAVAVVEHIIAVTHVEQLDARARRRLKADRCALLQRTLKLVRE